jgi:hypothetical protein
MVHEFNDILVEKIWTVKETLFFAMASTSGRVISHQVRSTEHLAESYSFVFGSLLIKLEYLALSKIAWKT